MIRRFAALLLHRLKEALFWVVVVVGVIVYWLFFGFGTDWLGRPAPSEPATVSENKPPPHKLDGSVGYDCEDLAIDHVSRDGRVIVLDDARRLLVGDAYQDEIDGWDGDDVTFCDGGPGHRFIVNHDESDEHVPVGLLNE